jgi:hypothetical protein
MRWGLVLLLCLLPASVEASYTQVLWDWTQGSGGSLTGFLVKCGRVSDTYTVTITVTDPAARSVSIYTATNNERGQWYCTVSAYHTTGGESVDGNEVTFVLPFNDPSERRGGWFGFGF